MSIFQSDFCVWNSFLSRSHTSYVFHYIIFRRMYYLLQNIKIPFESGLMRIQKSPFCTVDFVLYSLLFIKSLVHNFMKCRLSTKIGMKPDKEQLWSSLLWHQWLHNSSASVNTKMVGVRKGQPHRWLCLAQPHSATSQVGVPSATTQVGVPSATTLVGVPSATTQRNHTGGCP